MAFKEFYDYCQWSGINITKFLVQFSHICHKLENFDINLLESVQAFFFFFAYGSKWICWKWMFSICNLCFHDICQYESVKCLMILLLLKMEVMPPPSVKSKLALLMDNENDLQVKGWKRHKRKKLCQFIQSWCCWNTFQSDWPRWESDKVL